MDQEIKDLIAAAETGTDSDTSSDVALARMLQMQYDKEHNEILKAEERKYNGTNKGEIILFQSHIIFLDLLVLILYVYSMLTIEVPITTAADDIHKYFFIVLQRK